MQFVVQKNSKKDKKNLKYLRGKLGPKWAFFQSQIIFQQKWKIAKKTHQKNTKNTKNTFAPESKHKKNSKKSPEFSNGSISREQKGANHIVSNAHGHNSHIQRLIKLNCNYKYTIFCQKLLPWMEQELCEVTAGKPIGHHKPRDSGEWTITEFYALSFAHGQTLWWWSIPADIFITKCYSRAKNTTSSIPGTYLDRTEQGAEESDRQWNALQHLP